MVCSQFSREALASLFAKMTGGSGSLTVERLARAGTQLGMQFSREELLDMLSLFGSSDSPVLSSDEFVALFDPQPVLAGDKA